MKITTTKLLAATLITLLTASQSAMAMSEDSGDYSILSSSEQVTNQPVFTKVSLHEHVIGNSENGIDAAYSGGHDLEVFMNHADDQTRDLFDTVK